MNVKLKGWKAIMIAIGLAMVLTGCGTAGMGAGKQEEPPGMEGYVTAKENGRILVVDPVPKDFSQTGGINEFYNAIWFSSAPEEAEVGFRVQVWFNEVADSYPGQSRALQVKVLPSPRPAGAYLTEGEAIRIALQAQQWMWPPAVRSVEYDEESDKWTIQIRSREGESAEIQVEDRKLQ